MIIYTAFFLAFVLTAIYYKWSGSPRGEFTTEIICIYSLPQEKNSEEKEFIFNTERGDVRIVPHLEISINAVVWLVENPPADFFYDLMVKKKYRLTWGRANEENVLKYVEWTGDGFMYKNTKEGNESAAIIEQNGSNFYLSGFNSNINKALNRVKPKDHILIKGYLVDAFHEGSNPSESSWWKMEPPIKIRADVCNMVLVKELQINDTLYK